MTVLVVEDDIYIGNLIETLLQDKYQVVRAYSGTEALLQFENKEVHLVLLDLMLPGMSGEEVLEKIRGKAKVIVISAKDGKETKINNLLNGADDYITKPFDNDELLARVEVQLRSYVQREPVLSVGELHVDEDNRRVLVGKEELKLTRIEYDILLLLMKHPNQVFSKGQIFEQVWDYQAIGTEDSVKVHISNLRTKIGQDKESYRGRVYRNRMGNWFSVGKIRRGKSLRSLIVFLSEN